MPITGGWRGAPPRELGCWLRPVGKASRPCWGFCLYGYSGFSVASVDCWPCSTSAVILEVILEEQAHGWHSPAGVALAPSRQFSTLWRSLTVRSCVDGDDGCVPPHS